MRGAGSAVFILRTTAAGQLVGPLGPGVTLAASRPAGFRRDMDQQGSELFGSAREFSHAAERGTILELLRLCAFRQVLLIAALILSHAVIYWNSAGISSAVVGILWSEQVFAEVVVFVVIGPALLGWIGPAWATKGSWWILEAEFTAQRWNAWGVGRDVARHCQVTGWK